MSALKKRSRANMPGFAFRSPLICHSSHRYSLESFTESPIQKNQSIVLPLWQDRALKPQLRLQTPPTPAIPHQTSSSLQPTPDNHNAASAPKSTNMSTSIGPAQPEGTTISPSQIYKSYTANTSTNQAHPPHLFLHTQPLLTSA